MASPREAHIAPVEDEQPRCDICGWHDRKLRNVHINVTPLERIQIHKWARHGQILPSSWSKDYGKTP